jgi:hypothetical protein
MFSRATIGRPLNHSAYASADIIELAAGKIDEVGFCAFVRGNATQHPIHRPPEI